MAILTLKGMEHQTIPLPDSVHSRKEQASTSTSASTADTTPSADTQLQADDATAASADTAAGDPAVGDSEGLDSRAKIVKASMDEAAKEIPAYVKSITQQAETWQIQSEAAETPAERKTDSNILTAWLRHVAKDPFWLRPSREQREQETKAEKAAAAAAAERAEADAEKPLTEEEQRAAAKAEQELEQQLLQDEVQSQQRDRGSPESVEPSDPKTEGEERYLLSNPDYLSYIMENEVFDCHEFTGTGERHIKHIPRYPKFEVILMDLPM